MEFLENVGYTILGGGLAAIFGLVVQWVHTTRERRNSIKKIRELLKPEFEELYQILINDKQIIKKAKLDAEKDLESLYNHEMDIPTYLFVGRGRLGSLVWDAIISSGDLIKLDSDEIEIIQSAQQNVKHYNKTMDKLQKKVARQLKNELSDKITPNNLNLPDVDILHRYLDKYGLITNEAIKWFGELEKLPWVDYSKIKTTTASHAAA